MAQIGTPPHLSPAALEPEPNGSPHSLSPPSTGHGGRARSQPQTTPLSPIGQAIVEAHLSLEPRHEAPPVTLEAPPRSEANAPKAVDAEPEDDTPVRYTNATIEAHRQKLIEALRRPGEPGPDYLTAETCLQALVAENKALGPHAPEQLHIELGFGDVAPEDRQTTAALAKALRAAAHQIETTLDPECRRMLDLATRVWQAYEKADLEVGTRLSTQRVDSEGPKPRQSFEWEANAIEADATWDSPDQIRALEDQRNSLLFALMTGDTQTVTQILKAIPAEVLRLNRYFPPGQTTDVNVCRNIHKGAQKYTREHPASGRLQIYAFDCLMRAEAAERVTSDLGTFTEDDLDDMWPSEVRALCIELKHASTEDLVSKAAQFQDLIEKATQVEDLDHELAAQPYASLRTMQIQCTVLEVHIDADLLNLFRSQILTARGLQKNVSGDLQKALLNRSSSDDAIALWAVVEYAKRMTSLPFDYLSAGATWRQVAAMKRRLERLDTALSTQADMRAEKVAVQTLIRQLDATQQQAH